MLEMKRLESRACRAGVTKEMGGTVAGRRARGEAGEGRFVVVVGRRGGGGLKTQATVMGADTDHI